MLLKPIRERDTRLWSLWRSLKSSNCAARSSRCLSASPAARAQANTSMATSPTAVEPRLIASH